MMKRNLNKFEAIYPLRENVHLVFNIDYDLLCRSVVTDKGLSFVIIGRFRAS